ncbi:hypothetical protein [Haloarcula sp. H-GB5]
MAQTKYGIRRETVRSAGWPAVVAVLVMALFIEPWLQSQDLGTVALVVYVLLLPVIAWSLFEDIRSWRDRNSTDSN